MSSVAAKPRKSKSKVLPSENGYAVENGHAEQPVQRAVQLRPRRVSYTPTGKMSSVGIGAVLSVKFPEMFPTVEEGIAFWDRVIRFITNMLLDGHAVTLKGLVTVRPRIKRAATCWHPKLKKRVKTKERLGVKFSVLPPFRDALKAKDISAFKIASESAASTKLDEKVVE